MKLSIHAEKAAESHRTVRQTAATADFDILSFPHFYFHKFNGLIRQSPEHEMAETTTSASASAFFLQRRDLCARFARGFVALLELCQILVEPLSKTFRQHEYKTNELIQT